MLNLFNLLVLNIKSSESFKCNPVHFTYAGNSGEQSECTTRFYNLSLLGLLVLCSFLTVFCLSFLHADLLLDLTITAWIAPLAPAAFDLQFWHACQKNVLTSFFLMYFIWFYNVYFNVFFNMCILFIKSSVKSQLYVDYSVWFDPSWKSCPYFSVYTLPAAEGATGGVVKICQLPLRLMLLLWTPVLDNK